MQPSEASEVKAVLWDFGGVISTSPFDAFAEYEAAHGLAPGFIRSLNATNPDANAWARLERSEISASEFVELFEQEALAAGAQVDALKVLSALRGELRPSMVKAVKACHARLKTALLTNNFVPPDSGPLGEDGRSEVYDYFHVVVESSKVGCRKPDPRFYQIALDELGVAPEQAVFLDDLGVNLKPARQMGMRTIKVVDPAEALAELQQIVGFQLI
jgi:putative hydrolase of the HAD superfamily